MAIHASHPSNGLISSHPTHGHERSTDHDPVRISLYLRRPWAASDHVLCPESPRWAASPDLFRALSNPATIKNSSRSFGAKGRKRRNLSRRRILSEQNSAFCLDRQAGIHLSSTLRRKSRKWARSRKADEISFCLNLARARPELGTLSADRSATLGQARGQAAPRTFPSQPSSRD
jgi:hypothetical protein